MSISQHEQEVLDSVEGDLIGSGPELAAMLAMFTRLTANEEMPPYERVCRPVRAPSAGSAKAGAGPEKTRIRYVLSRRGGPAVADARAHDRVLRAGRHLQSRCRTRRVHGAVDGGLPAGARLPVAGTFQQSPVIGHWLDAVASPRSGPPSRLTGRAGRLAVSEGHAAVRAGGRGLRRRSLLAGYGTAR